MKSRIEMSGFRSDFFKVISDGDKVVLLRDDGKSRECYMLANPMLVRWSIEFNRDYMEYLSYGSDYKHLVPGPDIATIDLQLRGGEVKQVDSPLVMGVDIFDKFSITDYLDIINEKLKQRRY